MNLTYITSSERNSYGRVIMNIKVNQKNKLVGAINCRMRLLALIISLTITSIGIGQSEIAVVNLMEFYSLKHYHIGFTVFNNHDRRYQTNENLELQLETAFDSLSSLGAFGYDYKLRHVDNRTSTILRSIKKNKLGGYIPFNIQGLDYVLFLKKGTHNAYTTKPWFFQDFGFYTWSNKSAYVFAPIEFYLYNVETEKCVILKNWGSDLSEKTLFNLIEKEEKISTGSISEENIKTIEDELIRLIKNQVIYFESKGGIELGMKKTRR